MRFVKYGVCFAQGATVKQELKHEPVSTRVKMKIMPHLLRSRLAAECFPANIQVRKRTFDTSRSVEINNICICIIVCDLCQFLIYFYFYVG